MGNIEINGFYLNKKHKTLYQVRFVVTNCTNKDDGKLNVIYSNGDELFSRDLDEFLEKFTYIKNTCFICENYKPNVWCPHMNPNSDYCLNMFEYNEK